MSQFDDPKFWYLTEAHLRGRSTKIGSEVVDQAEEAIMKVVGLTREPSYFSEAENPYDPQFLDRNLQLFGVFMRCGMNVIYPLVVYEAMSWPGPDVEQNYLPAILVAHILWQYAPHANYIAEGILADGLDPRSRQFLKSKSPTLVARLERRCRITMVASLAYIVRGQIEWRYTYWPRGGQAATEWAEAELRRMAKGYWREDVLVMREAQRLIADVEERRKLHRY